MIPVNIRSCDVFEQMPFFIGDIQSLSRVMVKYIPQSHPHPILRNLKRHFLRFDRRQGLLLFDFAFLDEARFFILNLHKKLLRGSLRLLLGQFSADACVDDF